MTEQNGRTPESCLDNKVRNPAEPGNDDGTGCQKADKPRNPNQNQGMMEQDAKEREASLETLARSRKEQDAKRAGRQNTSQNQDEGPECQKVGRQASEPQRDPENDDGTGFQKKWRDKARSKDTSRAD